MFLGVGCWCWCEREKSDAGSLLPFVRSSRINSWLCALSEGVQSHPQHRQSAVHVMYFQGGKFGGVFFNSLFRPEDTDFQLSTTTSAPTPIVFFNHGFENQGQK
jgi:hypothetical protein